MKSPDIDAADDLVAASTNALSVLRQVVLKGKKVGPLYSAANTASWQLSAALEAFGAQASELATLRRRAEQMDALIYWLQVDGTLLDDTTGEQLEREAIERHKAAACLPSPLPPGRNEE